MPMPNEHAVRSDTHPQEGPCVIASRSADNPAASPAAPSQSTVPSPSRGRSGTTATTATITPTVNITVNQNTR